MTQVSTGTVTVVSGSATVSGSDTAFDVSHIGGTLFVGGSGPYVVVSVASATEMDVSPSPDFAGAGLTYTLTTGYSATRSYPLPEVGGRDATALARLAIIEIDGDVGTLIADVDALQAGGGGPGGGGEPEGYNSVADLLASTDPARGLGAIWKVRTGLNYQEVASGEHVQTAGGVKLRLLPNAAGRWDVTGFGVVDLAGTIPCQDVIQAAVDADLPLFFPAGDYLVISSVRKTSGDVVDWQGAGRTTIIQGLTFLTAPETPDPSTPTEDEPGPLSKCAFYFTSLIYKTRISDMLFTGHRFALAFLNPHNSPVFSNIEYRYCNIFLVCYSGCQNYHYEYMLGDAASGPLHASSFARYAPGSEFYGKPQYSDGLTMSYCALNGGNSNSFMDEWFRDSLVQPHAPSYSNNLKDEAGVPIGYLLPYDLTDRVLKVSGWAAIYMPNRNPRVFYQLTLRGLDVRIKADYGVACVDGWLKNGLVVSPRFELQPSTLLHVFTFGAIQHLTFVDMDMRSFGLSSSIPLARMTGRGFSPGSAEVDGSTTNFVGCSLTTPPVHGGEPQQAFGTFLKHGTHASALAAGAVPVSDWANVQGSALVYETDLTTGLFTASPVGNSVVNAPALHAGARSFLLPRYDTGIWRNDAIVRFQTWVNGFVIVNVENRTTLERDSTVYRFVSAVDLLRTTETAMIAGDTSVVVNDARRFAAGTVVQIGGETRVVERVTEDRELVFHLPVSAAVPIGAAITGVERVVVRKPQTRDWLSIAIQHSEFLISRTGHAGTSPTLDGDPLRIEIHFSSHMDSLAGDYVMAAPPTSGRWARCARIWADDPATVGYAGWICTVGGTPGTWQPWGPLAP